MEYSAVPSAIFTDPEIGSVGLTERAAQMFVLRYFEGHDLGAIARLLGTSKGVVAVTLFRTRNRLKKELASSAGEVR